jgi:hypothetical protein
MSTHGRGTTSGPGVLEDPSGGRARWMQRAARAVFLLFLLWLVAIVLGGLGVGPVDRIPLARSLRPSSGPPPARLPPPAPPSPSDLQPALPAPASPGVHGHVGAGKPQGNGRGQTGRPAHPNKPATPPGQAKPKRVPPGQAKPKNGNPVPPGQTKRTTTATTTTTRGKGR